MHDARAARAESHVVRRSVGSGRAARSISISGRATTSRYSLLSNAGGPAESILHAMSSLDCAGTELALISKTKFAEFSDQARCPPVDVVLLD